MQGAAHLIKQVLAQSALIGAPCLLRGPVVAASCRLGHLSWPAASGFSQQLSTSAKDDSSSEAAASARQQENADSSSSSSADQQASSSSSGSSETEAGSSGGGGTAGFNFSSFKSRFGGRGSSSSSEEQQPLGQRAQRLWSTLQHEVADAVLPRQERISVTRKYDGPTYEVSPEEYSGATAIAALKQPESRWQQLLGDLQSRFGQHPLLSRLRGVSLADNPLVKRGAELAGDIREKYETSDHPAVHKVEDIKEKLAGVSESAAAMALIRSRDPRFSMSKLLQGVRYDAPAVVKAFLTHDLATLQQHMGPELLERMGGIFRFYEEKGSFEDPTILFTGDPELVELKMIEDEPLLVVQFACQQIKCTRDKFGNVIEGDPNAIQKVFYFWGLQQEEAGAVLPDGRVLPPRWVIKDMMWQSMLSLI